MVHSSAAQQHITTRAMVYKDNVDGTYINCKVCSIDASSSTVYDENTYPSQRPCTVIVSQRQ